MRAIPFSASGVVGPAVAASGGSTLVRGVIITENAGTPAAAQVNIRNKGVITGDILLPIKVALSTTRDMEFNDPLVVNGAVYVEVFAGTVVGALLVD